MTTRAPHPCAGDRWDARDGTYIVTGATSGLGLETARVLAQRQGVRVVLAVRRPEAARPLAASLGPHVSVETIDLASRQSIAAFCARWRGPIAGLVNNAGIQCTGRMRTTADGLEESFAVNYLGALALTLGLADHFDGARVLFIGSGTQDRSHVTARFAGFRGARYGGVDAQARGGDHVGHRIGDAAQAGRDRYATSKLLCTAIGLALARHPHFDATFLTLDPGMMPGTRLARDAPAIARFAWDWVLPGLRWALPDTTSPARAGTTAAWLVAARKLPYASGAVVAYDGRPGKHVAPEARDPEFAQALLRDSQSLLRSLGYPAAPNAA